ncbi:unnamed protein product [Amoebophrya sp. A120]|nr:unnamed protein product [Amoebophrya sp. A120]|eukprot:GSA120T00009529001.1
MSSARKQMNSSGSANAYHYRGSAAIPAATPTYQHQQQQRFYPASNEEMDHLESAEHPLLSHQNHTARAGGACAAPTGWNMDEAMHYQRTIRAGTASSSHDAAANGAGNKKSCMAPWVVALLVVLGVAALIGIIVAIAIACKHKEDEDHKGTVFSLTPVLMFKATDDKTTQDTIKAALTDLNDNLVPALRKECYETQKDTCMRFEAFAIENVPVANDAKLQSQANFHIVTKGSSGMDSLQKSQPYQALFVTAVKKYKDDLKIMDEDVDYLVPGDEDNDRNGSKFPDHSTTDFKIKVGDNKDEQSSAKAAIENKPVDWKTLAVKDANHPAHGQVTTVIFSSDKKEDADVQKNMDTLEQTHVPALTAACYDNKSGANPPNCLYLDVFKAYTQDCIKKGTTGGDCKQWVHSTVYTFQQLFLTFDAYDQWAKGDGAKALTDFQTWVQSSDRGTHRYVTIDSTEFGFSHSTPTPPTPQEGDLVSLVMNVTFKDEAGITKLEAADKAKRGAYVANLEKLQYNLIPALKSACYGTTGAGAAPGLTGCLRVEAFATKDSSGTRVTGTLLHVVVRKENLDTLQQNAAFKAVVTELTGEFVAMANMFVDSAHTLDTTPVAATAKNLTMTLADKKTTVDSAKDVADIDSWRAASQDSTVAGAVWAFVLQDDKEGYADAVTKLESELLPDMIALCDSVSDCLYTDVLRWTIRLPHHKALPRLPLTFCKSRRRLPQL